MLQIATPARLGAAWLALCILGLALPPAVQAAPAAPGLTPAQQHEQDAHARNVAEKARFAARMVPEIAAVLRANPAALRGPRDADKLVAIFWLLRSDPDLQRQWAVTLTTPAADRAEQHIRVREFFMLPNALRQLAALLTPQDGIAPAPKSVRVAAVRLLALLNKENLPLANAREYAAPLAALIDKPDALPAAVAIIKDKRLHEAGRAAMLEHLVAAPGKGGPDMKRLRGILLLQHRYRQASVSNAGERILLPLEAVHPAALRAVRKAGVVPLAVYPANAPQPTLAITRHADLPAPRPGERLFILTQDVGAPLLAGTPLDQLAPAGPKVAEYTDQPRALLARRLAPAGQAGLEHPRQAVIAAACGPEDFAAHLASLAVVYAERERSLYEPQAGKKAAAPGDMPGARPRFTRQMDMDTLAALAPRADEKGLARLMGPIRAVWTRNPADGSWTETRYAPKGKSPASRLGVSPLLGLDTADLRAILADREEAVIEQWALYALTSDEARTPEEALRATRQQFDALRDKGFVSPLDMGAVVYLVRWHNNDPAMQERFSAILDDRNLSPRQRLAAMRAASGSPVSGAPVQGP